VQSACLTVVGLTQATELSVLRGSYSVNGVTVANGATRTPIRNGDQIRFSMTATTTPDEQRWESIYIDTAAGRTTRDWIVRTRNSTRAPQVWRVGPGRTHSGLDAVAPLLEEGDVVELDPGTYAPVRFTKSGSADRPIVIRGVGGSRPVIRGTSADAFRATVHFDTANHYLLENVEIDGGGGTRATSQNRTCVRLMGSVIVLRDVFVHDCPRNGLLGADLYSGTVVLDRVEVARAGAPATTSENTAHAIYIATDRDHFPGSVLRVMNSHIHAFEGNGIKSRAERAEIYFNWIETKLQRPRVSGETQEPVIYTLELIGYEEYEAKPRIDADVVGNVLVHRNIYGFRLGGDGTGASRGRVRLMNNSIVVSDAMTASTPLIRLFHALESLYLGNNVFVRMGSGAQTAIRLFRDDLAGETTPGDGWTGGGPRVAGHSNWMPTGSDTRLYGPDPSGAPVAVLADTQQGTANPGLANIAAADTLDVSPSGALVGGGRDPAAPVASEVAVPDPLRVLVYRGFARRPTSGSRIDVQPNGSSVAPNIGSRQ
jgi:hypothetical protein